MLIDAWTWIGWAVAAWWVLLLWPVWFGLLQRRRLSDYPPMAPNTPGAPVVSIIVPARDEEQEIESALKSFLALDYPELEIIAIDDRSVDATGAIMDRIAATDPRCRVIHVTALPEGWLGKNHANWLGARAARGEFLLFTDGDVKLQPPTLRHAVQVMLDRRLDHLTLYPDTGEDAFWATALMAYFAMSFSIYTRAALARFRWARRAAVGIGAFNLVRRTAYEAIGAHRRLRFEVADDVMLARLLKQGGFRPDVMLGKPLLFVRWQTGVGGIIRGLEKNAFAGTRFSLPLATLGVLLNLLQGLAVPVLAVTGPGQWLFAFIALTTTLSMLGVAVEAGYNPLIALCWPVGALLFAYTVARSTYLTLRSGGVSWRGTFYPLAALKAGRAELQPNGMAVTEEQAAAATRRLS